ncbi:peptidyl-prolyl cis-trans isomerase [Aureococcus anophagefferens]|nr:peptidyl-prolyl cis-trans isomerase [Aureococcus anophagefferens]
MADNELYAEMEETWGKRAARGMRTCVRGREVLVDGRTGDAALDAAPASDEGPEASPAPPADRNAADDAKALKEANVPDAKPEAKKPKTPREPKEPRAKKQKKSPDQRSLFMTSPTSHLLGGKTSKADAAKQRELSMAPRNVGGGLWVRDTALGCALGPDGAPEASGCVSVGVLYTARLHATKKRFDHRSNPNSPFVFPLGRKVVVDGFERGVLGMRVGGEREVVVPPDLGYGAEGAPPKVPGGATLHFTIKLVRVGDADGATAKAEPTLRRRARRARRRARTRSATPRHERWSPGRRRRSGATRARSAAPR